jgi:hypothetical protein
VEKSFSSVRPQPAAQREKEMTSNKVVAMNAPEPEETLWPLELISPTLAQIRNELHLSWFFFKLCYMPRWVEYLQLKMLQRRVRLAEKKVSA